MHKISTILAIVTLMSQANAFGINPFYSKLISMDLWHDSLAKIDFKHNQCVFFRGKTSHDAGKLVCYDVVEHEFVDCSAHYMLDSFDETSFDSFAVGVDDFSTSDERDNATAANATNSENPLSNNATSFDLFDLYPRPAHAGPIYMDNYVSVHGKPMRFALFHMHDPAAVGIHVIEKPCFSRLGKFFANLKHFDRNVHLCTFAADKRNITQLAELYIF